MIRKRDYIPEKFRDNFIKPGVKIKVTRLDGMTNLSHKFIKKECDVAYIRFFNHPIYEVLFCDIFLFLENKLVRDPNGMIDAYLNVEVHWALLKDLRLKESSDIEILSYGEV